jgi:hypothetical protein
MPYIPITPSSVFLDSVVAETTLGVAGEEIEAGEICYAGASDPEWNLALSFDTTKGALPGSRIGMALNHANPGQPILICTYAESITIASTLSITKGMSYWVDKVTPGKIHPENDLVTGQYRIFVGIALSTTSMKIEPVVTDVTD